MAATSHSDVSVVVAGLVVAITSQFLISRREHKKMYVNTDYFNN